MSTAALVMGLSDAAAIVADAGRLSYKRLREPASYLKQSAFEQLRQVWTDCGRPNWDGYGAQPVTHDACYNAYRLIDALPLGCPLPTVGAEPDGHVTLEWHRHPRWTLSVSVGPHGVLHYSALFGADDPRGSCPFYDEVPRTIMDFVERVTCP